MTNIVKTEYDLNIFHNDLKRLAFIHSLKEDLTKEEDAIKNRIQNNLPVDAIGVIDGQKICSYTTTSESTTVSWKDLPEDYKTMLVNAGLTSTRKASTSLRFEWKNLTNIIN